MDANQEQITPFDSAISPKQLQIIKSALPYIPVSEQKIISLYVKFQELMNTISLYDGHADDRFSICSDSDNINENLSEMVNSIKPYCNASEKEELDFLFNIVCAINLSHINHSSSDKKENENADTGQSGTYPKDTMNVLRSVLSPEQQNLLDSCSLILGMNK